MKESRTRGPGRKSCSSGIVIHNRYAPVISSNHGFTGFFVFLFVCSISRPSSSNYLHPVPFPLCLSLSPSQLNKSGQEVTLAADSALGTQQLTSSQALSSPPDTPVSCQGYAGEWRRCAASSQDRDGRECGIRGLMQIESMLVHSCTCSP